MGEEYKKKIHRKDTQMVNTCERISDSLSSKGNANSNN